MEEDRKFNYLNGKSDDMLDLLESKGVDILKYLDKTFVDITLNRKKYKIFYIKSMQDFAEKIKELEGKELKKEIAEKLSKKQSVANIENSTKGQKEIEKLLDHEISKKAKRYRVIQDKLKKQGYLDIVYDGNRYKIAPKNPNHRPINGVEKQHLLQVRITEEQNKKLKEYAKRKGLKVPDSLRKILDDIDKL